MAMSSLQLKIPEIQPTTLSDLATTGWLNDTCMKPHWLVFGRLNFTQS